MNWLHHILQRIRDLLLSFIILLYILFEDFIWKKAVNPLIKYLSAFHIYQRFLEYVHLRARRSTIFILFIIPFVIGEAIGILSGILAAKLYVVGAAFLYLCKVPLVVMALAILNSGKEKLLSYWWFALIYTWIMDKLDKLHHTIIYIKTVSLISHIRIEIGKLLMDLKKN
jgi:hypothetical protein